MSLPAQDDGHSAGRRDPAAGIGVTMATGLLALGRAASNTGLTEALDRPRSAAALAADLGLDERAVDMVLRALCVLGYAERSAAGYRRVSDALSAFEPWPQLEQVLREGTTADFIDRPALRGEAYAKAVGGLAERFRAPAAELARALPPVGHVVDVGAGSAVWSIAMASLRADTRLTAVDLPEVVPVARRAAGAAGLGDRFDSLAGDYHRVELTEPADRIVLANVLHLESERAAAELIARWARMLAPGGELVIVDCIGGESLDQRIVQAVYTVHLGMRTRVGKPHELELLRRWCRECGLTNQHVVPVPGAPGMGALVAARPRAARRAREQTMTAPTGEVALVFTDVESSCTLWEEHPVDMREALLLHDALMRQVLSERGGYEVKTEGDAFMVSFERALDAVTFCLEVQESLRELEWPPAIAAHGGLQVRMGVHLGRPHCEVNPVTGRMDYFGPVANRAARIASSARGGQILACADTARAAGEIAGAEPVDHGAKPLKGMRQPLHLVELVPSWRDESLGAPRSEPAGSSPGRGSGEQDITELLPRTADGLIARGRVRALRGDAAAIADLRLAVEVARVAGRDDLGRRALLALLAFELEVETRDVLSDIERLERDAHTSGDLHVAARALVLLARCSTKRLERLDEVEAWLDRASALADRLGDVDLEVESLLQRGLLFRRQSRFEEALDAFERARARIDASGSRRHLSQVVGWLGNVKAIVGQADERLARRAIGSARRAGHAVDEAWAVFHLGQHQLSDGHLDEAVSSLSEARTRFEAVELASGAARAAMLVAVALAIQGRTEEADARMASVHMPAPHGADPGWMAHGSYQWHGALVHLAAGRPEQALQAAGAALELLAGVPTHPLHRMTTRLRDLLEGTSSLPAPSTPESRALILDLLRPE